MLASTTFHRRILLVDDDENVRQSVGLLLRQLGYQMHVVEGIADALMCLRSNIIHMVIVDVRLERELEQDQSGLFLLNEINPSVPKIVMTAYSNSHLIRRALENSPDRRVFIDKTEPDAVAKLLQAVKHLFADGVPVNFDLEIPNRRLIVDFAKDLKPLHQGQSVDERAKDIEEILRRLFYPRADLPAVRAIHLNPLVPGVAAPGSRMPILAVPELDGGYGAAQVVKLGPREEIDREFVGFHQLTARLRHARHANVEARAYSRDMGGLLVKFLGGRAERLVLFRDYYREHSAEEISYFLKRFLRASYKEVLEDKNRTYGYDLRTAYVTPLELTADKLRVVMQQLLEAEATKPTFTFESLGRRLTNPVVWIMDGADGLRDTIIFETYVSWTHGDLHSRNILVDEEQHGWLIDFARAEASHCLRDFIELETDIKFALLPVDDLQQLLRFEEALLEPKWLGDTLPDREFGPELQKAYRAIGEVRASAHEMLNTDLDMREYYQALLYQTLNVMRLRGGPLSKEPDRRRPLIAAALICERLDHWPDRPPQWTPLEAAAVEVEDWRSKLRKVFKRR